MTDLKHCPFCGCDEIEYWNESAFPYGDNGWSRKRQHFTCKKCPCRFVVVGDNVEKSEAVALWNARVAAVPCGETAEQKADRWEKEVIWQCVTIQDQPTDKETFVANWLSGAIKIPDEVFVRQFRMNEERFDSTRDKVVHALKQISKSPYYSERFSTAAQLAEVLDQYKVAVDEALRLMGVSDGA